eukprot:195118-Chlamydomonas_euryale.AAC.5
MAGSQLSPSNVEDSCARATDHAVTSAMLPACLRETRSQPRTRIVSLGFPPPSLAAAARCIRLLVQANTNRTTSLPNTGQTFGKSCIAPRWCNKHGFLCEPVGAQTCGS